MHSLHSLFPLLSHVHTHTRSSQTGVCVWFTCVEGRRRRGGCELVEMWGLKNVRGKTGRWRDDEKGGEKGREATLRYNESREGWPETVNAARRVNEHVSVWYVWKCWIACAPGGLAQCSSKQGFFIILFLQLLCVCDGSPAETKSEDLCRR